MMTEDDKNRCILLGENIRETRKLRKMTLQEVADLVGTSKSYIYEIEKGKSQLSFKLAAKISRVLNIDLGYMASCYNQF